MPTEYSTVISAESRHTLTQLQLVLIVKAAACFIDDLDEADSFLRIVERDAQHRFCDKAFSIMYSYPLRLFINRQRLRHQFFST